MNQTQHAEKRGKGIPGRGKHTCKYQEGRHVWNIRGNMLNGSKEEVSKTVKCKKNKLRFLVRRMQDSVNNAKNHSCSYVESRLQKNQQQKPEGRYEAIF